MTDAQWKAELAAIVDPLELLIWVSENTHMFNDPYYSDLSSAMRRQMRKVIEEL